MLDELADFSIPAVTHHLLQSLEFLIPVDPIEVFKRIVRTIHAGQNGRYQFKSMTCQTRRALSGRISCYLP